MTGQTIYSIMHRRRREVAHRIAALESELEPLKRELAEIDRMAAAGDAAEANVGRGFGEAENALAVQHVPAAENALLGGSIRTIKKLVTETLRIKGGATSAEIREFITEGFGVTVSPDSLRPQLSRLKADGVIRQNFLTEQWSLVQADNAS